MQSSSILDLAADEYMGPVLAAYGVELVQYYADEESRLLILSSGTLRYIRSISDSLKNSEVRWQSVRIR